MTKRIRDLEKDWKDLIVRSELSKLKEFNDLAKELSDESTFKIVREDIPRAEGDSHEGLL